MNAGDDTEEVGIGKRFADYEARQEWGGEVGYDCGPNVVRRLSKTIDEGERILKDTANYEYSGIIASQTALYLTMAYANRARCYFFMADKARAANDESAEIQYSQRCIEDDDRHTELSHRYRTGVAGLGSSGRNLCLRVAGRHTQALSEAISATEVNPCSESFLVLSYCYEDMGNRSEAIKAATRALAVAKNDYYRNRAQERIGSLRT